MSRFKRLTTTQNVEKKELRESELISKKADFDAAETKLSKVQASLQELLDKHVDLYANNGGKGRKAVVTKLITTAEAGVQVIQDDRADARSVYMCSYQALHGTVPLCLVLERRRNQALIVGAGLDPL
eukprot:4319407-Pleurochrysis_carterae.AAC.2